MPFFAADPAKAAPPEVQQKGRIAEPARALRRPAARRPPPVAVANPLPIVGRSDTHPANGPAIHINLQIHISADASTEQIDQVFVSMAKHIYKKSAVE
jgi:hypothetical protein